MLSPSHLITAALLLITATAARLETRADLNEFRGDGVYQILSRVTGTAVNLYNGDTEIYGWPKSVTISFSTLVTPV